MHGFININKPPGITSFDVIRKIRRVFPRKTKIGHLGTLDPMASGVLPLAIGDATRLLCFLGEETKSYMATMVLGAVSDTQDAWGTIKPIDSHLVSEEELLQILPAFTGIILQIPPMYSAVHHQGQRLYDLARQGVEVEREPRQVEITRLELLQLIQEGGTQQARVRVVCSKGTYIRTLCHDIGTRLGTGAYMSELVRTQSGAFSLDTAYSLDDIINGGIGAEDFLLPLDYPLSHLYKVYLTDPEQINSIRHGGSIKWLLKPIAGPVKIYSDQRVLMGIGYVKADKLETTLNPVRILAGSTGMSNT